MTMTKADALMVVRDHLQWLENNNKLTVATAIKKVLLENEELTADYVAVDTTTAHNETFRTAEARQIPTVDRKKAIRSRVGYPASRPMGYDVWRWPEFLALAKRLGLDLEIPTVDVTITMPLEECVSITQKYFADDIGQKDAISAFEKPGNSTENSG